ncbi:MAG: hypothetical protein A4E28_00908 [Methanocella sp. PtaU1.Bin125]|nr:MAG: hypothetical protein A4E28_00908 [Methanocella sp. PtaU1.Bin125]
MGLRKWLIVALIVLIALGVTVPALAWKVSKIGISVGDIFYGNEASLQKPSATLFHSQNLAATDTEALAINFPTTGDGSVVAPTIAQTVAGTTTATDTGFFKANYCYTSFSNLGGFDLAGGIGSWHPLRSPLMVGSGISWPYMNNAPLYGQGTMQFQPAITTAPDTSQISFAPGTASSSLLQPATLKNTVSGIGGNNTAGNATGGKVNNVAMQGGNLSANKTAAKNATATPKPVPPRDYKNMTKTDIQNTSGLERLYRNANMVNPIPKTYKGTVDRPTMIAPVQNPMADILLPANKSKVISDAGNMTKAGTALKTKGWDL